MKSDIEKMRDELASTMFNADGLPRILNEFRQIVSPEMAVKNQEIFNMWVEISNTYSRAGMYFQAIQLMWELYIFMLRYQEETAERVHKGDPLVWLRDYYFSLGFSNTAMHYAMLTLCEDAVTTAGNIDPLKAGIYYRLSIFHGLSEEDILQYASSAYNEFKKDPISGKFPEWILQNIGTNWMVYFPSSIESLYYRPNTIYIKYLIDKLGDPGGKVLEQISAYILSIIPGFRILKRKRTPSTDYDIICSIEGQDLDFRAELGRYILCECKDWQKPMDFSAVAKFARVLASAKCKTGIIFSKNGISGKEGNANAARELLKIYQDSEIVILIIDLADIEKLGKGANFIAMLRQKNEIVRLDISDSE